MAITLGPTLAQSLLSGANIGSGIAQREAQSEAQRKQQELAQQQLAMQKQLQPYKLQQLQAAADMAKMKQNYLHNIFSKMSQTNQQAQPTAQGSVPGMDIPFNSGLAPAQGAMQAQPATQTAQPVDMSALHQHIQNMQQAAQQQQSAQQPAQQQGIQQPFHIQDQGAGQLNPMALSFLGLKAPAENPVEKANLEVAAKKAEDTNQAEIKSRAARLDDIQSTLPEIASLMQRIPGALKILSNNPDLFGPGIGGHPSLGGSAYRQQTIRDPEKLAKIKEVDTLLQELQGLKGKQLSGSRVLASALKLAGGTKASIDDHPAQIQQVLFNIGKAFYPAYQSESKYFKKYRKDLTGMPDNLESLSLPPITNIRKNPNTGELIYERGGKWYR